MPVRRIFTAKGLALILSLLVILTTVGGTLAYFIDRTDPVDNEFVPVMVDCQPTSLPGGIAVLNSGEVEAYIRAAVVVNWVKVDADGNAESIIHANQPIPDVDYSISYDPSGAWQKGSDGFWYYKVPVAAGALTDELITAYSRITPPPEGYKLSIEVLAIGVQSDPAIAVEQAFGVSVNGDSLVIN